MSQVSELLSAIDRGETQAAEQLLPIVYEELRKMAAMLMAKEPPGQTLQATALVHEAYLRLVDEDDASQWNSRGHFFAAAALAMRRILIERARRKNRIKHGGELQRNEVDLAEIEASDNDENLIALDAALTKLHQTDATAAELVQLRYFTGLTLSQCAEALDISPRSADRMWAYARAWLHQEISTTKSGG